MSTQEQSPKGTPRRPATGMADRLGSTTEVGPSARAEARAQRRKARRHEDAHVPAESTDAPVELSPWIPILWILVPLGLVVAWAILEAAFIH